MSQFFSSGGHRIGVSASATSNEDSVLISFRIDWFDLFAVPGTLKSLLQHHSSKASILWHSALITLSITLKLFKMVSASDVIFVGLILTHISLVQILKNVLHVPKVWPPHAKSWLIGKDSDAGRDWGQEEKGTTEDEMAGWHH